MKDVREDILNRLVAVCEGIAGIIKVQRNRLDVYASDRPAIVVMDGSEELELGRPNSTRRFAQVQFMRLSPEIRLLLRADSGEDAGTLISLYRARIILAVAGDANLRLIVGADGTIQYDGCSVPDPNPETKEPRLDLSVSFVYPLKLSDLV